jgi:hypothetical protein
MKCILPFIALVVLIPLAAKGAQQSGNNSSRDAASNAPAASSANKEVATRLALRQLWLDHIFWVRAAVVATHDKNTAARDVAEAQAVANAKAIAESIKPFYGEAASEQLFKLLGGHWGAIKAYLTAKGHGNQPDADKAAKELYANAEEIGKFLSSANPNWPESAVRPMLSTHAGLHIRQIDQIYAGQYDREAKTWEAFVENVNGMGDALASGLAKQFPDKF